MSLVASLDNLLDVPEDQFFCAYYFDGRGREVMIFVYNQTYYRGTDKYSIMAHGCNAYHFFPVEENHDFYKFRAPIGPIQGDFIVNMTDGGSFKSLWDNHPNEDVLKLLGNKPSLVKESLHIMDGVTNAAVFYRRDENEFVVSSTPHTGGHLVVTRLPCAVHRQHGQSFMDFAKANLAAFPQNEFWRGLDAAKNSN
jgi:hypothetical protein